MCDKGHRYERLSDHEIFCPRCGDMKASKARAHACCSHPQWYWYPAYPSYTTYSPTLIPAVTTTPQITYTIST